MSRVAHITLQLANKDGSISAYPDKRKIRKPWPQAARGPIGPVAGAKPGLTASRGLPSIVAVTGVASTDAVKREVGARASAKPTLPPQR
ncbi:hypothetical protein SALB1_1260 [Salinisphaera sp. LB1]|nr:hypothetical protein SALB1_1260 [Salinisphaera sp. LB1]